MQDLRHFIRLLLQEVATIPVELRGKKDNQPAFVFGKKSKEYLSEILNTNSSHRVATEDGVKYMNDVQLVIHKLNNMLLSQYSMYDAEFRKNASGLLTPDLLKAIAIEETTLGVSTSSSASTAEGILQVLEGTLETLNKRRARKNKKYKLNPPLKIYTEADRVDPVKSIEIGATLIKDHLLGKENYDKDGLNLGGEGITSIDKMLGRYKTGPDSENYAKRVRVYQTFINALGGV